MTSEALTANLEARIVAGDERALARAATLIENGTAAGRELVSALFPRTGKAMIVGITGPPGVGKSTLVNGLVKIAREAGKTVGIIAADPSSPYSRGAILGDRIRMQNHHSDPGVFIRSMASRGTLGGIAHATLEIALLLDASGRDLVLIETVGAGQDEVEIAQLADLTVVVLVPGLGDDVQAIKAGMMEIADVFAINKADLPGAARLEQEMRAAQTAVPIRQVIATEGNGCAELFETMLEVFKKRGHQSARAEVWARRLRKMLCEGLLERMPQEALEAHARRVAERLEDPYTAVSALREQLLGA